MGLAACTGPEPDREGVRPLEPTWHSSAFEQHLRHFNRHERSRVTGTEAYLRTARYIAQRLRRYQLQPALESGFLVPYDLSRRGPSLHLAAGTGSDTTAYFTGIDVLAHSRTDVGRFRTQTATILPSGVTPGAVDSLVITTEAEEHHLRQLRERGARAVLVIGELTPQSARSPISGLLITQITPAAAQRLLGISERTTLSRLLNRSQLTTHVLPQVVRFRIDPARPPAAETINVIGYVTGRVPEHLDDAVLVCADLDALEEVGQATTRDLKHFGIGAAAIVEVARHFASVAQYTQVPERSIIFAVWSGERHNFAGLRAYLNTPVWDLENTESLFYVGLRERDVSVVGDMLDEHNIGLHPISLPADSLFDASRRVAPTDPVRQRAEEAGRSVEVPPAPDRGVLIERGAQLAQLLARKTFDQLLGAVVMSEAFKPAAEDTMRHPSK